MQCGVYGEVHGVAFVPVVRAGASGVHPEVGAQVPVIVDAVPAGGDVDVGVLGFVVGRHAAGVGGVVSVAVAVVVLAVTARRLRGGVPTAVSATVSFAVARLGLSGGRGHHEEEGQGQSGQS